MPETENNPLKKLRDVLQMNQQQLAIDSSCTQSTISVIEKGNSTASRDTLCRIYAALHHKITLLAPDSEERKSAEQLLSDWAKRSNTDTSRGKLLGTVRRERRPLVQHDDKRMQFARRNSVAKRFHKSFSKAFRKEALPDPFYEPVFEFAHAPLYVTQRTWLVDDQEGKSEQSLAYEQRLDDEFWSESPEDHRQLVIISGEPGSGKSTLIQAYLRSYCPKQGRKKDLFAKKVPVIVNFNGVTEPAEFDQQLYSGVRGRLVEQCRKLKFDIESADNYRMFAPRLDVGSKLFEAATGSDKHYVARQIIDVKKILSDEEWVSLALEYLSTKLADSSGDENANVLPIQFVVLCLDNLDNSPFEIQLRAIELCIRWMKRYRMAIWQFYLPLWPETMRRIKRDATFSKFDEHDYVEIPLGQVDPVQFLNRRLNGQLDVIRNDEQPSRRPSDSDEISTVESIGYIEAAIRLAGGPQIAMIRNLSGWNLRCEIDLWQGILSSKSLLENYLRKKEDKKEESWSADRFGRYDLTDALITGKYPLHNRAASLIVNLFYTTDPQSLPWDSLLGPHLLWCLDACRTSEELIINLLDLGYDDGAIMHALEYLREGNLFDYASAREPRALLVRPPMILAYKALLKNAAYLDNMAMVTPVEEHRLEAMRVTNSYDRAHFINRVITTIEFLSQLRDDEEAFYAQRSGAQADRFRVACHRMDIPRLLPLIGHGYAQRLNILRDRHLLRDLVPETRWDEFLGHDVFRDIDISQTDE